MIWKEKYNLGVPIIDEQHKELFKRVGTFMETVRSQVPWEDKQESVKNTLEFMSEYVVTHFKDEEKYQKEIGYPQFEAHCTIHKDMVAYVSTIAKQFEEGYKEQLIQQFAGKLLAWLINHVAAEDQKIADFAKSREDTNNDN